MVIMAGYSSAEGGLDREGREERDDRKGKLS
jgi:hypothetical protein